jgi:hypothetical protein
MLVVHSSVVTGHKASYAKAIWQASGLRVWDVRWPMATRPSFSSIFLQGIGTRNFFLQLFGCIQPKKKTLIYNLSQNEISALMEYIEENLTKNFIQYSKFPTSAPILIVKKKDRSLRIYVDYYGLNEITVKNCYPLPLISRLLD